jgi:hypothetical protein
MLNDAISQDNTSQKKDDKPCTCVHSPALPSSLYTPLDSQWPGNCGPESPAQAITVRLVV